MGEFTTIMARDGHEFRCWLAAPPGSARRNRRPPGNLRGELSHPRSDRRLCRPGLRRHRAVAVRSHQEGHRARLHASRHRGRARPCHAAHPGRDPERPHRRDQCRQARGSRRRGRLLLGRCPRLSRRLRAPHHLRRVLLRCAHPAVPRRRQAAEAPDDVSLRRARREHPAGDHRADPRGRPGGCHLDLSRRARLQLHRARGFRPAERRTRTRAVARVLRPPPRSAAAGTSGDRGGA